MSTLVLSIGIAVTFMTIWGVIIVGSYMLGIESSDALRTRSAESGIAHENSTARQATTMN